MTTLPLPDPGTLATLISNVTQTMCGLSFAPADPQRDMPALWWRIAILCIAGAQPVRVTLSSDRRGCERLGAALFGCPADALDPGMIDDSLCELLNMAAGQIKAALALDQALGLPRIVPLDQLAAGAGGRPPGLVLASQGDVNVVIGVAAGDG